jgi:hypothetical protein
MILVTNCYKLSELRLCLPSREGETCLQINIMLRQAQELEVSTEAFGLCQLLDSVHGLI